MKIGGFEVAPSSLPFPINNTLPHSLRKEIEAYQALTFSFFFFLSFLLVCFLSIASWFFFSLLVTSIINNGGKGARQLWCIIGHRFERKKCCHFFFQGRKKNKDWRKREVVIGEGRHYHWLEANVEVHDLNEGDIWMICMRLSYRCFGDGACDSRGKAASMVLLVLFCCQWWGWSRLW